MNMVFACARFIHDFMTAVHGIVHKEREKGVADPTASVMDQLTQDADVICFDEMEVRDIADAMIIARVMDGFMRRHGVLVVSNRHLMISIWMACNVNGFCHSLPH